jgi:MGT family glycosyltransferase
VATVLAYSSPGCGHLFPLCALLIELSERGHHIHVRTTQDAQSIGRQLGFHTGAIDPRIEEISGQDWSARGPLAVLKRTIDVLCRRAALEVNDLLTAIATAQPDVVIVDANCWGAASLAEARGIPWLIFSPFTPYLRSPGVPPFGPGLRRRAGVTGTMRDAAVRPVVTYLFDRPMVPRVNAIRTELGLAPVDSVDALMRRAPLLLAVGGEPLEYPHPGWGDNVHLIGACAWDPAPTSAPTWLTRIHRPIVLVSTSSLRQADTELGITALRALATEPVHVIATFPAGIPAGLPQTPNATVRRFVPHAPVLHRAACVISHGGMGTTVKALDRGVPVCVVPYARDQAEVARRVEAAGCGTRLPAKRLTAHRLRAGVGKAMTMVDGARRVAPGFAATGGVGRGAELVEQLILPGVR